MLRRIDLIGMMLIFASITLADSDKLIVPFLVMITGAVMVLIGRREKDGEQD